MLLESAFGVAKGLRPCVDFAHAQMPLLEWVAAIYIRVAGASIAAREVLNGAAIYATTVLIIVVGRRAVGRRAAVAPRSPLPVTRWSSGTTSGRGSSS